MTTVPHATPSVQPGLDRLAIWLGTEGYPNEAICRILIYTHREGTPTGAPDLDATDEEWAEHEFVAGIAPVAGVSPEWDEHHSEPGRGPVYRSVDGDYVCDQLTWSLGKLQDALADTEEMPLPAPISGGAPIPEPTADELRRWYDARPSFQEWLDSEGGPA